MSGFILLKDNIMSFRVNWLTSFCRHVAEAAKKQLNDLWHTTNVYYHPAIHEYAELMASKLPGNLKVEKCLSKGRPVHLNPLQVSKSRKI